MRKRIRYLVYAVFVAIVHPNTTLHNKTIPLYCVNTQINSVLV